MQEEVGEKENMVDIMVLVIMVMAEDIRVMVEMSGRIRSSLILITKYICKFMIK